MAEKTIYIASPLGFYEAGLVFLKDRLLPLLTNAGYSYIDPWTYAPIKLLEEVQNMPYSVEKKLAYEDVNRLIGAQNASLIDKCDGMVAVLDGTDVDSGTASEIGYCSGQGKPVLGYRSDFRLAGDNEGAIVNLQVEYFIRKNSGAIVHSLDDIKKYLPIIFK